MNSPLSVGESFISWTASGIFGDSPGWIQLKSPPQTQNYRWRCPRAFWINYGGAQYKISEFIQMELNCVMYFAHPKDGQIVSNQKYFGSKYHPRLPIKTSIRKFLFGSRPFLRFSTTFRIFSFLSELVFVPAIKNYRPTPWLFGETSLST